MSALLDLTPHARAAHWTAAYIGMAWLPAFTCWGLFRQVQRHEFAREVPELDVLRPLAPEALRELIAHSGWLRSAAHASIEGDALVMRGADGPHIGVLSRVDGRWRLLHNVGGMVRTRQGQQPEGGVRLDLIDELPRLGYGRFEQWSAPR